MATHAHAFLNLKFDSLGDKFQFPWNFMEFHVPASTRNERRTFEVYQKYSGLQVWNFNFTFPSNENLLIAKHLFYYIQILCKGGWTLYFGICVSSFQFCLKNLAGWSRYHIYLIKNIPFILHLIFFFFILHWELRFIYNLNLVSFLILNLS